MFTGRPQLKPWQIYEVLHVADCPDKEGEKAYWFAPAEITSYPFEEDGKMFVMARTVPGFPTTMIKLPLWRISAPADPVRMVRTFTVDSSHPQYFDVLRVSHGVELDRVNHTDHHVIVAVAEQQCRDISFPLSCIIRGVGLCQGLLFKVGDDHLATPILTGRIDRVFKKTVAVV